MHSRHLLIVMHSKTGRTARLAQAAWAVTSAGAEVTDRVVLLVRALMEADR